MIPHDRHVAALNLARALPRRCRTCSVLNSNELALVRVLFVRYSEDLRWAHISSCFGVNTVTMIKRSRRQQRQTILYTCSHHLFPTRCSIEVAKLDDSIAVVTLDKQTRRSWRQRVSIFLLSTLIQKYYYDLELLWNLLTKGVLFNGTDVEFSTQHIHTYPHAVTHDGNAAQLIWQVMKSESYMHLYVPLTATLFATRPQSDRSTETSGLSKRLRRTSTPSRWS
jgi:hypothetical protein